MVTVGLVAVSTGAGLALWTNTHHKRPAAAAVEPWDPPSEVAPGERLVRARLTASGTVVVDEWVQASAPLSTAQVVLAATGPARAYDLVVHADGVRKRASAGSAVSSTQTFDLGSASRLHLRYRLSDAVRDTGAGRALLRTTGPMLLIDPAPTRTVVTVTGVRVLGMVCVPLHSVLSMPCGRSDAGRWSARLTGTALEQVVFASIRLRRGGS